MKFIHKAIKKGFTLVELVIVIAVIAVLAAVLIPVFSNVIKDANISKTKANLNTCSNTLIMFAQYYEVDYYTPQDVKEFLKTQKFDIDKPIMDGYSIWYNQRNFNLSLVKNSDLNDYINGNTVSASVNAVVAYADEIGASSALDNLPRRLEAITPNEDLLLMATDKENFGLIELIDQIYTLADSNETGDMFSALKNTLNKMKDYPIMAASSNGFVNYYNSFKSDENSNNFAVAWLNSAGNWVVSAEEVNNEFVIAKSIVSPEIGKVSSDDGSSDDDDDSEVTQIKGIVYSYGLESGALLKFQHTAEITASKYSIKFEDGFYEHMANSGANIVISGKVNVSNSNGPNNVSVSHVSTASGIVSQISNAVNSGTGTVIIDNGNSDRYITQTLGAEKFQDEWLKATVTYYDSIEKKEVTRSLVTLNSKLVHEIRNESGTVTDTKYKVFVTNSNGQVESVEMSPTEYDAYFNDNLVTYVDNGVEKQKSVSYKYNTPQLKLNVAALMAKESITSESQVNDLEVKQTTHNGVTTTTIILNYTRADGVTIGKNYYLGVGQISYFDHYYSYYKEGLNYPTGFFENYEMTNNPISQATANAGSVGIKLPAAALNLQSYKSEDFKIEIYYTVGTDYYKNAKSNLGTSYIQHLKTYWNGEDVDTVWNSSEESTPLVLAKTATDGAVAWTKDVNNVFYGNFGAFAKVGSNVEADYYVNRVKINRIIIKDSGGNVLIAKYPD